MDRSVLPKLKFFYCRAILPEIFTKPVKRGLKLYLLVAWEIMMLKNDSKLITHELIFLFHLSDHLLLYVLEQY